MEATATATASDTVRTTFRPMGRHVLVEQHRDEERTTGGLWLPERAIEDHQVGTVLAVGPDVGDVEVGQVVAWARYEGHVTPWGLVLTEAEVLLVSVRDATS